MDSDETSTAWQVTFWGALCSFPCALAHHDVCGVCVRARVRAGVGNFVPAIWQVTFWGTLCSFPDASNPGRQPYFGMVFELCQRCGARGAAPKTDATDGWSKMDGRIEWAGRPASADSRIEGADS